MRLLLWPRSMRAKLVIALLVALMPVLVIEVLDAVGHARKGTTAGAAREMSMVYLSLAAALLGVVVAFVTGSRLARPISRLTHAANAIAVGDYRKRVRVHTRDELQSLAEAFNALGRNVARHEAAIRQQAEMLAGMAEAARVASSSLHVDECGRAVAKVMCTHLGAKDATVFRKAEGEEGVKPIGRCGKRARSAWRLVARRVAESGDQLMIAERNSSRADASSSDDAFLVGVPLSTGDATIGAIVARFEGAKRRDLEPGSVRGDILATFGIHAAAAISNAEAYSQSEEYSEVLEEWVDHLSAVMQVTDAISPSLTLRETLEALARATAAAMSADVCAIFRPDCRGNLETQGCSRPRDEIHRDLLVRPVESEVGRSILEKRTVLCRDMSRSKFSSTRHLAHETGLRSTISTPLVVADRSIGAVTLYSSRPRQFMPREVRLLTSISLHTAVIVRNADLYTRESSIAEALQSALVSEVPEECRGLKLASRYIPALEEARVGGDFYEVTPLPNGKLGVVMGDVSGKGLNAAIHLAACKYMMKPLMYAQPDDPGAVLTQLNDALNYYFDGSFFVTIFYALIDTHDGSMLYANAGHQPALLISDGAKMHSLLMGTGMPVGSGNICHYGTLRETAKPTDLLLLYTDGVTDASNGATTLGIEGLEKVVFEAGECSATQLIDHVCGRLSAAGAWQRDDMALLAISFDGVSAPHAILTGGLRGQDCCV